MITNSVDDNPTMNQTVDPILIARARKARYDDLPNFSGYPSEDAERFLKSIKNIAKANDSSTDQQFLEIVRGKLTQAAGSWFDDHESQFTKWSDFETAFRNRYFSTTIITAKFDKLSQRKQRYDESVTTYFDDITTLCREIDPKISDRIIIQHLMKGINPEIRKELTRRQSAITTLTEFLRMAKLEQDIHDTSTQIQETMTSQNTFTTYHLSSHVHQKRPHNKLAYQKENNATHIQEINTATNQSSKGNWNSYTSNRYPNTTRDHIRAESEQRLSQRFQSNNGPLNGCKVCGKRSHRSIDCMHKKSSGCYNCGQRHAVRDCRNPPHFQ